MLDVRRVDVQGAANERGLDVNKPENGQNHPKTIVIDKNSRCSSLPRIRVHGLLQRLDRRRPALFHPLIS